MAISHIATETLEKMYQTNSNDSVVNNSDLKNCCILWYIILNVAIANHLIFNISSNTTPNIEEPVTGSWNEKLAQRNWKDILKYSPGIKLPRNVINWIITLCFTNTGKVYSSNCSPIICDAQKRMKPLYISFKLDNISLMKKYATAYGLFQITEIVIYHLKSFVSNRK